MGKLKVLPSQIANMIAAGEVVQRPASVIKELVENAVDAGATKVGVVLTDAGRTLVQVIDDGSGMTPSDAVLCFERHATSKIDRQEDLEKILTYGFRGEALASISSVSEVTLRTRRAADESGTQVTISDFNHVTTSAVSCPAGSNFSIRNLFYNTPARRKFLKSDNVELRHCIDEFVRIAIPHPEMEFTLTHNSRDIYVLRKTKSVKMRLQDIFGAATSSDLVDIDTHTAIVSIKGFIGKPDKARKMAGNQMFFLNGRYFRSPYLHKAVMKAYDNLVPEGYTPSYYVFLEVEPSIVDINIHPTKAEVKFEDDSVIFQILNAAIKETLGKNAFGGSLEFDTPPLPNLGHNFGEYSPANVRPSIEFDPSYNPFNPYAEEGKDGESPAGYGPAGGHLPTSSFCSGYAGNREDCGVLFSGAPPAAAEPRNLLIVRDKYIVSESSSGIMTVNIKRARERVLYEKYLQVLEGREAFTQTALFPVQVKVGVEGKLLLEDNAKLLASLGFDIVPFGNDTVAVNGVPQEYSCEEGKVEGLVQDLLLILSDEAAGLSELLTSSLAEKFSTLGSVHSGSLTSATEARALLDSLFSCSSPEFTSSGKRVFSIVGLEEIDKRFL